MYTGVCVYVLYTARGLQEQDKSIERWGKVLGLSSVISISRLLEAWKQTSNIIGIVAFKGMMRVQLV